MKAQNFVKKIKGYENVSKEKLYMVLCPKYKLQDLNS